MNTPYHSVTAWNADQVDLHTGADTLIQAPHPTLSMANAFCPSCGDGLFDTNAMGWRMVSQHLITRSLGSLPEELQSKNHFFYGNRIVDIDNDLPEKD